MFRYLRKSPYIWNSLIYGMSFVGAEIAQQIYQMKRVGHHSSIDTNIVARYFFYGTFLEGPFLVAWYNWLDRRYCSTSFRVVLIKLFLDQCVMSPCTLVAFYLYLEPNNVEATLQKIFLITYAANCLLFVPAQIINFVIVPPPMRVIYVGVVSFIWLNLLCYFQKQQ